MADIVENALNENDLEIENLRQQLQKSETEFAKLMHEKSLEMDNLQSQLEQKCMEIQQAEYRMTRLQKESLENRDALTVEVAEKHDLVIALRKELALLEEQCRQSDMQTHFKDDIIKEMRRELKQAKSKPVHLSLENTYNKISSDKNDNPYWEFYHKLIPPASLRGPLLHCKSNMSYLHQQSYADDKEILGKLSYSKNHQTQSEVIVNKNRSIRQVDHKIVTSTRKLSPPSKDPNSRK